ncbi:hypothetical protein [Frankia sp. CiP3]|uniref:hypothetical protein n=1 Tax=Frankia sp. CiP3 TaxID=2880971 RepID=UPI0035AB9F34
MTTTTTDPMSDTIPDKAADALGAGTVPVLDEELARRLVAQARAEGVSLTGPGGMLGKLTKLLLETALEVAPTSTVTPES